MQKDQFHGTAIEIRILAAIATKKSLHAFEQRLESAHVGVSGLQYGILHALSDQEQTISELSDTFMLDPSTLVPAVDALERKGLAKRGKDPNDRRRIPISLTEHGAEIIACVPTVDETDPLVRSLQQMEEEQCMQLLDLLRELVRH
ncbi:MAG: MarR family transcriptional regulator, partial [Burkholderiales bacterium]|nr:MarR family transcriptional regulator [Burkholderiales bacterium]